jgi:hypothetical protein
MRVCGAWCVRVRGVCSDNTGTEMILYAHFVAKVVVVFFSSWFFF